MLKLSQSLGLQDSFSSSMFHISSFHDQAMVIVVFIVSAVLYVLLSISWIHGLSRSLKENELLEAAWTIFPCVVLACLAAPSLVTLYLADELQSPFLSVKVTGHQWYWSYEYGDGSSLQFDSYMIPSSDLEKGDFRLLECDVSAPVPANQEVQLIVGSGDVIHSWALPSLGVKIDAVPGRLNQASFFPTRVGKVYGQCSEICGGLHSFMPICLEILPSEKFLMMLL